MRSAITAWQFLTVLPLPRRFTTSADDLSESVGFFPAVGIVLGIGLAGLDWLLRGIVPLPLLNVILLTSLWALTGGLHADGLADTADGFFSRRPREKILEIMRDPRSGPMAVISLIGIFALKWTALEQIHGTHRTFALVLMPWLGRTSLLVIFNQLPYARTAGGIVSVFINQRSQFSLTLHGVLALAFAWLGFAAYGLALVVATGIFVYGFGLYQARKIGGFTGDTLGATCELSETWFLILAATALHGGQ